MEETRERCLFDARARTHTTLRLFTRTHTRTPLHDRFKSSAAWTVAMFGGRCSAQISLRGMGKLRLLLRSVGRHLVPPVSMQGAARTTHMHACTHTACMLHTCMHACTHTHMHAHACTHACTHMHAHMRACMHVCMHMQTHAHACKQQT